MLYVVGGCSRSGKSTLAERMRVRHGVPWFSLDALKMGLHLGATTLAELAGAAGLRWTVEECFGRAKDDLGLDHCEARSWHGWHRHVTLVMAAAAFLARLAADLRRTTWDLQQPAQMPTGKANETSPNVLAA